MKKSVAFFLYRIAFACALTIVCCITVSAQETDTTYEASSEKKSVLDSSERFFNTREPGDPFVYDQMIAPTISKKKIDELKSGKEFWYVNEIDSIKGAAEKRIIHEVDSLKQNGANRPPQRLPDDALDTGENGFYGKTMQTIFWIVIITVFCGAIVYFLASNKVAFWAPRKKDSRKQQGEEDLLGENIFSLPYKDLLDKAYKEGNYRLAIRILYLQTLKILSDKQVIRFQPEYTNIHYLMQLSNTDYYQDFSVITRHYEYVWYGKFAISQELYEKLSSDFSKVQKRIK